MNGHIADTVDCDAPDARRLQSDPTFKAPSATGREHALLSAETGSLHAAAFLAMRQLFQTPLATSR